ncbi:MAG TPA: SpoIIE family protein phosphatase [Candidatus Avidesulfovibrio excrementigallinarum]|nr:SpoIIE family protein phosphatase [Candidatus Avidesulfovibrio excrementigallinarum]
MTLTLRMRLALLVVCAVALSVGLALYLTWQKVDATVIEMEEKNFATLLLVEEERLNAASMNHLASKVRGVIARKTQLRDAATRVMAQLRHAGTEDTARQEALLAAINASAIALADKWSVDPIRMEIMSTKEFRQGRISPLGLTSDMTDAKQRSVRQLLTRLTADGDFAVMKLPRLTASSGGVFNLPAGLSQSDLVFLLPLDESVPKGQIPEKVLICAVSLDDLENMAYQAKASLLQDSRDKFENMQLVPGGLVALLDADGSILASGGDGHLPAGLAATLKQADSSGLAKAVLPSDNGDMLCLAGSIRAFGWYVVTIAPLAEIRAPSSALLASLIKVTVPIVLLAALIALLMLIRTLRPLSLLTGKANEIAEIDLTDQNALDRLDALVSRGLPLERRDELGQLARSFAHMGRALAANIRNLMDATASKERMEGELSAAREIQMGILPSPDGVQEVCGFRASAFLDPAKEVGGDLYDFFSTSDGRRALVLGDVSGKGVPAALFMSMTVTLVRYALDSGLDPAAALSRVNGMLEAHNPGNMFVTLFLAIYDPVTGDLAYANGGHCPPYVVDANTAAPPRALDKLSGPLVGVMPDMEYTLFTDRLEPGEICLIFTDGVTEAMNTRKELYGEDRLRLCLAQHRKSTPKGLLTSIFEDLVRFRGSEPQSDDITMLAFCRTEQCIQAAAKARD